MRKLTLSHTAALLLSLTTLTAAQACSDNPDASGDGKGGKGDGDLGGAGSGDGDGGLSLGGKSGSGASSGDGDGDGDGPVCETASQEAELAPIFLAFAFDVSGSMGHLDKPRWWHDPAKKWEPVVEATSSFFQDASSEGISASMTFFPALDNKCTDGSYETPDVAMQGLPSTAFATAFNGYETEVKNGGDQLAGGNWRGSTPTLAAFNGTSNYLGTFQSANPDAKFAVVLVTDGLPQNCGTENDKISTVATAVGSLYNAGAGVPTYVIGIQNPTEAPAAPPANWGASDWGSCVDGGGGGGATPCEAPNLLSGLDAVASAGGTDTAFLIDTEDPVATQSAFRAAIDAIRTQAVSCELGIPEHPTPGMVFEADKIDVSYTVGSTTTTLVYDPECLEAGAWHYDDEGAPSQIILCTDTCSDIQSTPGTSLNVDFLCEAREDIIR